MIDQILDKWDTIVIHCQVKGCAVGSHFIEIYFGLVGKYLGKLKVSMHNSQLQRGVLIDSFYRGVIEFHQEKGNYLNILIMNGPMQGITTTLAYFIKHVVILFPYHQLLQLLILYFWLMFK